MACIFFRALCENVFYNSFFINDLSHDSPERAKYLSEGCSPSRRVVRVLDHVQGLLLRLETIITALSKSKNYSHQRVILLYLSQLVPPETDIIPIVHKIDTKMAEKFISRYDFDMQNAEAQGIEKGRDAEKVALVYKAFLKGLPINLISQLVDLPEAQVEAIVQDMNK